MAHMFISPESCWNSARFASSRASVFVVRAPSSISPYDAVIALARRFTTAAGRPATVAPDAATAAARNELAQRYGVRWALVPRRQVASGSEDAWLLRYGAESFVPQIVVLGIEGRGVGAGRKQGSHQGGANERR